MCYQAVYKPIIILQFGDQTNVKPYTDARGQVSSLYPSTIKQPHHPQQHLYNGNIQPGCTTDACESDQTLNYDTTKHVQPREMASLTLRDAVH